MKLYRLPLRLGDDGVPRTDILDADGFLVATVYPVPQTDCLGWVPESIPAAEAFAKLIVESVNLTLRGGNA